MEEQSYLRIKEYSHIQSYIIRYYREITSSEEY